MLVFKSEYTHTYIFYIKKQKTKLFSNYKCSFSDIFIYKYFLILNEMFFSFIRNNLFKNKSEF